MICYVQAIIFDVEDLKNLDVPLPAIIQVRNVMRSLTSYPFDLCVCLLAYILPVVH